MNNAALKGIWDAISALLYTDRRRKSGLYIYNNQQLMPVYLLRQK